MSSAHKPAVTWLLPVRNGMPYLSFTLRSIAEQTYSNHKIIAWENGSNDDTLSELQRWIPRHIPGQIVTDKPLRLGSSLAALVEMADTELCARIDADDINYSHRLERQVSFMQENPAVGVLGSQADFIDQNGEAASGWSFPCDDATLRWRTRWSTCFMHPTVLFRRSAILEAGNYADLQPFEDAELWMRVANLTEFQNLPDSLIQYRRSSTSETGNIRDFRALLRQAAKVNAKSIFPGVPEREVMPFWEASSIENSRSYGRMPLKYIVYLYKSAILLARKYRKDNLYFVRTRLFNEQLWHLRRAWMHTHGSGHLRTSA